MSNVSLKVAVTTVLFICLTDFQISPESEQIPQPWKHLFVWTVAHIVSAWLLTQQLSGQKDHSGFLHLRLNESCQLAPSVSKEFKLTKQSDAYSLTQRRRNQKK